MITTVRMYPSETQAREAAGRLTSAGFVGVSVFAGLREDAEAAVRTAVKEGKLPGSHARICAQGLASGRAVVAVPTPFSTGLQVVELLESCGAIDTDLLPPHLPRNPSPLSDLLGLPVLADYAPMTELSSVPYTFGSPGLSKKAAPLSSLVGLKTLTTPRSNRTSSFGLPLLGRNPAPLSSTFRIPTLKPFGKRTTSFGFPMLSKNPAPFSSLFGLRLLSRKRGADRS